MSLVPSDEVEIVVQQTSFSPANASDSRSYWTKFIDLCRRCVGMKPMVLADRFAEAKVAQEEATATAILLEAQGKFELAKAEAAARLMEAEGKSQKDLATARLIDGIADGNADQALVDTILKGKSVTTAEALEQVELISEQIRLLGGHVEWCDPSSDE